MKVTPTFPPPTDPKEFLRALEILEFAAGQNTQQVANDLDVTRPTISRLWKTKPPTKWWYYHALLEALRIYRRYHQRVLDPDYHTPSWRKQASQQALLKIDKYLESVLDENTAAATTTSTSTTTFTLTIVYDDGETSVTQETAKEAILLTESAANRDDVTRLSIKQGDFTLYRYSPTRPFRPPTMDDLFPPTEE